MTLQDSHHDILRQFLAGRDVACPGCGYNLRDLLSERCPECGQQIELAPRLVEPRQAGLIAGLIGISSGLGFSGLLLIYVGIGYVVNGRRFSGMERFFIISGSGFLVHAVALTFWLLNWRRLRRSPAALRRILIILCWALPLAEVVVMALDIR